MKIKHFLLRMFVFGSFALCCAVVQGSVTFTNLFSFSGIDGIQPQGKLLKAPDGNLYGTARETMIFFDGTNGANPYSSLIKDKKDNFYGTTLMDGLDEPSRTNYAGHGFGTVFKISSEGKLTTLVVFNGTNGRDPKDLLQCSDGSLYGITEEGGGSFNPIPVETQDWTPYNGFGTVFRISPDGKFSTLFVFNGVNGKNPNVFLLGNDGNFYGTTSGGGENNLGIFFKISPNGKMTKLLSFSDGNGGWQSLIQDGDGVFYGTTSSGGKFKCGSIFRLTIN